MTNEKLIQDWTEVKQTLSLAKAEELRLRNLILPKMLGTQQVGSKTEIFGGYKVTVTAKINYSIDAAELIILGELTEEEQACIIWKPTLKLVAYHKLPAYNRLTSVVTAKPGQGTLEVK